MNYDRLLFPFTNLLGWYQHQCRRISRLEHMWFLLGSMMQSLCSIQLDLNGHSIQFLPDKYIQLCLVGSLQDVLRHPMHLLVYL